MKPLLKVSIVIPVFNAEKFIIDCINSIIDQNYPNIECILVNDCSSDKSQEKIEQFIENYVGDISFKLFSHDKNKGPGTARNLGVQNATGDYILFLDSDDMIMPNALQNLIDLAIANNQPNVIVGNIYCENDYFQSVLRFPSDTIYPAYTKDPIWIKNNFLLNVKVIACSKIYNRKFILDNKLRFEEGVIFEDVIWHFTISQYIKDISFSYAPFYYYRFNENSIMNSKKREKGRIDGNVKLINTLIQKSSKNNSYIEQIFILKLWHRFRFLNISEENQAYYDEVFKRENDKILENPKVPQVFKLLYKWLGNSQKLILTLNFFWNKSLGMLYRYAKAS